MFNRDLYSAIETFNQALSQGIYLLQCFKENKYQNRFLFSQSHSGWHSGGESYIQTNQNLKTYYTELLGLLYFTYCIYCRQ